MKIARIQLYRYDIPFVRPFVTSQFTLQNRIGLILTADAMNGNIGLGEIAPLAGFSRETIDECIVSAKNLIRMFRNRDVPQSRESLQSWNDSHFGAPPSVIFGFETMLADLAAQTAGIDLAEWYRGKATRRVSINAVIAGEIVESEIRTKYQQGYRTLKLKVGSLPIEGDVERIAAVRGIAGTEVRVRLDANRAYQTTEAVELIRRIEPYNIEYIEEPLRNATLENLAQLRQKSSVPIAIDETLVEIYSRNTNPSAQPLCDPVDSESYDVAVVKPSLMGGIGSTIEFCEHLIHAGKHIVVTSALDAGIGVTTALHIACALRLSNACGLDTSGILENRLVDGMPAPFGGSLALSEHLGLGIRLSNDPEILRHLTELHVD